LAVSGAGNWATGSNRISGTSVRGQPSLSGADVSQHLNLLVAGKACTGQPGSEPDSGNPTVRDRRGARGDMAMGVGLRPTTKAVEAPPNPKARAPRIYPDIRTSRFDERGVETERQPPRSGRPGRLPASAPHRSGRAQFRHPALQATTSPVARRPRPGSAIRRRPVEMVSGLGVPGICPSGGLMARRPLPSAGSLGTVPPRHR